MGGWVGTLLSHVQKHLLPLPANLPYIADLSQGNWLPQVLAAAGPRATILSMTPGLEDFSFIQEVFPCAERYAAGTIGFISYQAPLARERFQPTIPTEPEMEAAIRIALFQPPMSPSRFSCVPKNAFQSSELSSLTPCIDACFVFRFKCHGLPDDDTRLHSLAICRPPFLFWSCNPDPRFFSDCFSWIIVGW